MTEEENPLFEQHLNNALDGLEEYFYDHLKNGISKLNALTIVDYILAMKVETNLSTNHKRGVVTSLNLSLNNHRLTLVWLLPWQPLSIFSFFA
jgi:hypothetical protein